VVMDGTVVLLSSVFSNLAIDNFLIARNKIIIIAIIKHKNISFFIRFLDILDILLNFMVIYY